MKMNLSAGITLIEVLVVIAIMAVLTGLASLSMGMIRRERVRQASSELFADLQRLRYEAMTHNNKGMGIRVESNSTYILFSFDDCDQDYEYDANTCENAGREEANSIRRNLDPAVEIKKTNPATNPNNDILIFDRFGMPRTKTWAQGPMKFILKSAYDSDDMKCVVVSLNRIREGRWTGDSTGCSIE